MYFFMDKKLLLDKLKTEMKADTRLPLREAASNLVFGDGNPDSEILFIGEGPGYWEDVKGIPFVGNAGSLLNRLLLHIGIKREDIYITNIIHYRAPENRDPEPVEIEAFKKYLDEIIRVIDPKLIITLGRFSMAKFLPGVLISAVHGKEKQVEWEEKEITVIPMYHPAAALRSTDVKLKLTTDFERIPQILRNIKEKGVKIQVEKEKESEARQMSLI